MAIRNRPTCLVVKDRWAKSSIGWKPWRQPSLQKTRKRYLLIFIPVYWCRPDASDCWLIWIGYNRKGCALSFLFPLPLLPPFFRMVQNFAKSQERAMFCWVFPMFSSPLHTWLSGEGGASPSTCTLDLPGGRPWGGTERYGRACSRTVQHLGRQVSPPLTAAWHSRNTKMDSTM